MWTAIYTNVVLIVVYTVANMYLSRFVTLRRISESRVLGGHHNIQRLHLANAV
jgi:hypothetical protein